MGIWDYSGTIGEYTCMEIENWEKKLDHAYKSGKFDEAEQLLKDKPIFNEYDGTYKYAYRYVHNKVNEYEELLTKSKKSKPAARASSGEDRPRGRERLTYLKRMKHDGEDKKE